MIQMFDSYNKEECFELLGDIWTSNVRKLWGEKKYPRSSLLFAESRSWDKTVQSILYYSRYISVFWMSYLCQTNIFSSFLSSSNLTWAMLCCIKTRKLERQLVLQLLCLGGLFCFHFNTTHEIHLATFRSTIPYSACHHNGVKKRVLGSWDGYCHIS